MASYKLSNRAAIDISEIYEYGIFKFGLNQAQSYLQRIEENLEILVSRPELSRKADYISKNLYRLKYQSHLIFFILTKNEASLLRILEQHMGFPGHLQRIFLRQENQVLYHIRSSIFWELNFIEVQGKKLYYIF